MPHFSLSKISRQMRLMLISASLSFTEHLEAPEKECLPSALVAGT
jgi:hypothetical protein